MRPCKYYPSSYTRDTSAKSHESFWRLKADQRFRIGNVAAKLGCCRISGHRSSPAEENLVIPPFMITRFVESETIEGQIGEVCLTLRGTL